MKKTYREENDKIIKGVSLPVFIDNIHYHMTEIHVYEDGLIDCWELVDINGFKEKVKSGWVKTTIPNKSKVFAFPLGNFELKKFAPNRTEQELIKEVEDIILRFQGQPTSENICLEKYKEFINAPNENNKIELKLAYENVPRHNRKFLLGDMDVDDIPIRVILYGSKIFKESQKAKIQEQYIREQYLKGIEIK